MQNSKQLNKNHIIHCPISNRSYGYKIGFNSKGEFSHEPGVLHWSYIRWKPTELTFEDFVKNIKAGYSFVAGTFKNMGVDDYDRRALTFAYCEQELKVALYNERIDFFKLPPKRGRRPQSLNLEKRAKYYKWSYKGYSSKIRKTDKTFGESYLIVFDIDNGPCSMEQAIKLLDIKPHFAYTTVSNNDREQKYKYRFIYMLDSPVKTEGEFLRVYRNIGLASGVFRNFVIDSSLANYHQFIQGGGVRSRYYVNYKMEPLFRPKYLYMNETEVISYYRYIDLTKYSFNFGIVNTRSRTKDYNSFEWGNFYDLKGNKIELDELYNRHILKPTNINISNKKDIIDYLNTEKFRNNILNSIESKENKEFWHDCLGGLQEKDFIYKYRKKYPYFFHTEIEFNDGYALLDDNYKEIFRKWEKNDIQLITNGKKVPQYIIKQLKDGQHRRKTLYRNGLLMRCMKNDSPELTLEYMTYLMVCESYYYYDNSDNVLNHKTLRQIAQSVLAKPYEDIKFEHRDPRKYKVDRTYARAHGLTPRQLSNQCRATIKYKEIDKVYNPELKIKENLKNIQDAGIKCSQRTLYNYRLERGYIAEKKALKNNNQIVNLNNNNSVVYKIDINTRVNEELSTIYEIVDNLIVDKTTGEYMVMDKENVLLLNTGKITLENAIDWYLQHDNNTVSYWRNYLREHGYSQQLNEQNNNMDNIEDELKNTKIPPINGFPKGDTDHLMEMFKQCDPNAMKAKPSLMMLLHMSQEEYKQYTEQQKKYEVPDDGMGCSFTIPEEDSN